MGAGASRRRSRLTAAGAAVGGAAMAMPARVVGNAEIGAGIGVDDRWIRSRSGVRERRHATADEALVDFASAAAERSLAIVGLDAADVDLLLVATMTPDRILPNAAPVVAGRIGAPDCAALDVGAACSGWLGALLLATAQIEAGRARHALVVGADLMSRVIDFSDRATAPLFGDGAGAVVVSARDGETRVDPIELRNDPGGAASIHAEHEEGVIRMAGPDTFKHAVNRLAEASLSALAAAGRSLEEVDLLVFHQANGRIIDAVTERLGADPERVVTCVDRFGNTAAATIPVALATAAEDGRLRDGSLVLLAAFGAGFTFGGGLVEWGVHA